jgi:hypothetical protein
MLFAILQIGSVQTFLAQKATNYLSDKLKVDITIGKLQVTRFLEIALEDVVVNDQCDSTMLSARWLFIDIGKIDTRNHLLRINRVMGDRIYVNFKKYQGDSVLNLNYLTGYFASKDTGAQGIPWNISCNYLKISNGRFLLHNMNRIGADSGTVDFNRLDLKDLNISARHFLMIEDTLFAQIDQLEFSDQSGFSLIRFNTQARVSPVSITAANTHIETGFSKLDLDLSFLYQEYKGFSDFLHSVRIQSTIRPSHFDSRDLGFFVPSLIGINQPLDISGTVNGPVSNLKAKDLLLFIGDMTSFNGDITMSGLPAINETYINLKVRELMTSIEDCEKILTAVSHKPVSLPDNLDPLGNVRVSGRFTGFVNDFVSYARFSTDAGTVSTDLSINPFEQGDISYQGQVRTVNFNIGRITGAEDILGRMNLDASITGQGTRKESARIRINGAIDSLELNNYTYDVIKLNGDYQNQIFNGTVKIDDKSIGLDFRGLINFSTRFPQFDFNASIRNAHLFDIGLVDFDSVSNLSTTAEFQLRGETIDSLSGYVTLDETVFVTSEEQIQMDHLRLSARNEGPDFRAIELESDFVDAFLEGDFLLEDFYPVFSKMVNRHISQLPRDTSLLSPLGDQDFLFEINLKDLHPITEMFMPELILAPSTVIRGNLNTRSDNFDIRMASGLVEFSGIKLKDWQLEGNASNRSISLNVYAQDFLFKDAENNDSLTLGLERLSLDLNVAEDDLSIHLNWNDTAQTDQNNGDLVANVYLQQFPRIEGTISKGEMLINGFPWKLVEDNYLIFDSSMISIDNFGIEGFSQRLLVNGVISDNPANELIVSFDEFSLDNFQQIFQNLGLSFGGIIKGELKVSDLFSSPRLISQLNVKDFEFNDELLGDILIQTAWDRALQKIITSAEIIHHGNDTSAKVLSLKGDYNPMSKENNFDFTIKLDNLKIKPIGYFMKDVFSNLDGYAKGELFLKGKSDKPSLTGEINVRRGRLKIDFLKVKYTFSDKITFGDGYIGFDQMTVLDTLGNPARINGKIYHKFFKDFALDLEITPENMIGMNTTASDNPFFYGTARATGAVKIYGPADKLAFDIRAKTEKGTSIYLPISYTADVSENTYIQFIQSIDTAGFPAKETKKAYGLDLKIGMDVTNDASIQIFLPMQMGNIKVNGNGLLNLGLAPNGDLSMLGTYTMNAGTFYFTLKNLISRTFQIKQGSTISWAGDMYEANIDLKAVYKVKPSLSSLPTVSVTDSSLFNERVPVDCIIGLSGDLFNPTIKFSLDMPDVTEEQIRSLVFNSIDTTNEFVMNQQMISLLVMNSFSFSTGGSVASSMGISSYDILTNQINNWLSQISNDFDIGLNYQKGDAVAPEQLEVALSTQLFNNRILVNGNFGVGNYKDSEKTSNIVGDVLVEYKITEDGKLRVRAYNKTNTYDLINDNAPYTQGVGISFKKDFNRFKEIFQRKKKKKQENETALLK